MLAVGPGGLDKDGKRIAPSVAPGDKVLIPQVRSLLLHICNLKRLIDGRQYGGSPVKVQDEEYSLFRDHEYAFPT